MQSIHSTDHEMSGFIKFLLSGLRVVVNAVDVVAAAAPRRDNFMQNKGK